MIAETIAGFASYLAEEGFVISPERIGECLSVFGEDGIDCTDYDDTVSVMRFFFCSNEEEARILPELFSEYIQSSPMLRLKAETDIDRIRKEMADGENRHNSEMKKMSARKQRLEKERDRIEDEIYQNSFKSLKGLNTKDRKFLEEKGKWIRSMQSQTIRDILNERFVSAEAIEKEERKLIREATKALMKGDARMLPDVKKLFQILKAIARKSRKAVSEAQQKAREATTETRKTLNALMKEMEAEEEEHRRKQFEIDRAIRALERSGAGSVIHKKHSEHHRDEFIGGKNAVRQVGGEERYPKEADKNFDKLSAKEKQAIIRYIRDNILKFKTKMNRNLTQMDNGSIDMLRTIQEACRTGGRPFHLMKQLKRPGKTNLALVLDVSGSCKEASAMLLTFMCLLKEVFPRGCNAYVFVNSLYDITELTTAENPEDAIDSVLELVPRAGQYSNYDKPIRTLWNEYRTSITKDTIVIMMGDARNNKNPSAEEEWKNICRRAKKVYWLNTDAENKWNHGDSIASTYAKYAPMTEIRNTKDLLTFIDSGMR